MALAAATTLLGGALYANANAASVETAPSTGASASASAPDSASPSTPGSTSPTNPGSTSSSHPSTSASAPEPTGTAGTGSSVSDVVDAANAFLDTLDDDQQAAVLLDFTQANATAWSNEACGATCRVGIELSTLSDKQLTAAKAVLEAATGTGTDSGYDQISQILAADDVLAETDSSYGSGNYYLAFLGTPSASGTWQLHFGGDQLALNITYKDGEVVGSTPYFAGVEPTSWTDDGTTYAPLAGMHDGVEAMLEGLSDDELSEAELSDSTTDVVLGPDEDGDFPDTKEGLAVSELTDDQQQLVLDAITPWVEAADDTTAASTLSTYKSELDDTYISYSGTTALDTAGDYVRIDGPGVWIEFSVKDGVVDTSRLNYSTVYRDHDTDYGGEFSFS
ncbi:DUF3500 domain-containing protein [Streptomyces prunicolor]|uniref:DUF3500 domain-containing protein n=1 Tax=Streptomyces prunicolor TaxID=67348 RepID=A0ABU4F6X1_9ACTN|nr:DUF3500 domain-containing protein [Streptomyces prunicolor]MDV7216322.1 DUF3500 domain-containing protein [Streptomyces prunicolor]